LLVRKLASGAVQADLLGRYARRLSTKDDDDTGRGALVSLSRAHPLDESTLGQLVQRCDCIARRTYMKGRARNGNCLDYNIEVAATKPLPGPFLKQIQLSVQLLLAHHFLWW